MPSIPILTPADADQAYAAAQCVVTTHTRLVGFLRVGQTLGQIDQFIARTLEDLACKSCFRGYRQGRKPPFPSHACLSVNECVVHGTAGYYTTPLAEGDLLKVDVGVFHRGWVGDAAWTYAFKSQTPLARKLMDCGKESLRLGVKQLGPNNVYLDWARTVQGYVEGKCKFHLIREMGGHGIGFKRLHGEPFVSMIVPESASQWPAGPTRCRPGTLIAVEPMIGVTTGELVKRRGHPWPEFIADGDLSVHYEHDVLVTEKGPRVLTEGMEKLPDVVG